MLCPVLAVLGFLLDPVDSAAGYQDSKTSSTFLNGSINHLNNSLVVGDIILSLPSILSESGPIQLHLIYDQENKDSMLSLNQISPALGGITITVYDEAIKIWSKILIPSFDETMVALLCSAKHTLEIFQLIKQKKLMSMEVNWLLVLRSPEDEVWLFRKMEGLILEGTRVALITRISSQNFKISISQVDLDGVTRFSTDFLEFTELLPHIRNQQYLHRLLSVNNKILYSNMQGRQMTVAVNTIALFAEILSKSPNGEILRYQGIEFAMLNAASQKLNFTYVVVKAVNGEWGNFYPDGTATGMIGMVYRREVDFGISCVGVSRSRSMAVDFTFPFFMDSLGIITKPLTVKNPTFIAFAPFTAKVWLSITVATLFISPLLKLLPIMTDPCIERRYLGSIQVVSFNIFRSIVIQGNFLEARAWSQRSILYSWYLFCLIISALYSGTLISILAIPSFEKPIDSLHDLPRAVSEGYTVGTRSRTVVESLFKNAREGIYRDTWLLFNHEDLSQSLLPGETGYDLTPKRKLAYIAPKTISEGEMILRGRSLFRMGKESFFNMWLAWACTQGAPFKEHLDRLIMRMIETGLIAKWKTDEFRKMRKFSVLKENSGQRGMKLIYLQAAFYLLLLGSLVSTTVFLVERVNPKVNPKLTCISKRSKKGK